MTLQRRSSSQAIRALARDDRGAAAAGVEDERLRRGPVDGDPHPGFIAPNLERQVAERGLRSAGKGGEGEGMRAFAGQATARNALESGAADMKPLRSRSAAAPCS